MHFIGRAYIFLVKVSFTGTLIKSSNIKHWNTAVAEHLWRHSPVTDVKISLETLIIDYLKLSIGDEHETLADLIYCFILWVKDALRNIHIHRLINCLSDKEMIFRGGIVKIKSQVWCERIVKVTVIREVCRELLYFSQNVPTYFL